MGLWSNVTSIASDVKDKVSSAVSNATSSIGTWLNDTYNNAKTASVISTPSASTSSSDTTTNSAGASSIYDSTNKTTTTPTQYSSLAAYETDKTKTTAIENIQKSLNTIGYTYGDEGELKVDGDFGIKTQTNWDNFISDLGVDNYLSGIATGVTNLYNNAKEGVENLTDNIKIGYNKLKDNETLSKSIESGILTAIKYSPLSPLTTLYEVNTVMENYAAETGQTVILGLQGSAAAAGATSLSIGYAVSPDGEKGIVVSNTLGAGTPNLFVGGYISTIDEESLKNLESDWSNPSLSVGGSVGMPVGISGGYDYSVGNNSDGEVVQGHTISAGLGVKPIPVEMHGTLSKSDVYTYNDIINAIFGAN